MDIKPVRRPIQQPQMQTPRPAGTPGGVRPQQLSPRPQQQLRPQSVQPQGSSNTQPPVNTPPPQPVEQPSRPPKKMRKWKKALLVLAGILLLGILIVAGGWIWYQTQLSPVDKGDTTKVKIEIKPDTGPTEIASLLHDKGIIKNETAFMWYTRINGVRGSLQAGAYRLSPSESTSEIVDHLVNGSVDTFSITFYPGATLVDTVTKPEKRIDVTTVLQRAGYTDVEIAEGLSKKYDHPVFEGKPASADLEGYVFGETYEFNSGVTVEDILTRTFDELNKWVVQDNLVSAYKAKGLTLYQGLTLASIVQRESGGDDKAQIAQVFYTRLADKMMLGSDVTYQYIADKTGVTRDPNLDSPYNTRRYVGLPPGPIAVPGLSALQAVAKPAEGNYVYFLSGDDHVTYFARTLAEHEANIANHCKVKCQII
jgi:UPF0755 protein